MDSFRSVIDLWPSVSDLATALGENVSTVQKWRTRNRIPSYQWWAIVQNARARGYAVTLERLASLAKEQAA